jgi:hypothetical protein
MNGVDFTEDAVQFRYVLDASVSHVTPSSGPSRGGTLLTVHGSGFTDSSGLSCVIRRSSSSSEGGSATDTLIPAMWLSSSRVACESPSWGSGAESVSIHVTANRGVDVSETRALFEFVVGEEVSSVSPSRGPVGGGSLVSVVGSGFRFTGALQCRFGLSSVPAVYVSSTEVRCETPELPAGVVDVRVSSNGVDFSSSSSEFEFVRVARISSVSPSVGSVSGGTRVSVMGSGFEDREGMKCRFGESSSSSIVPATFVSMNELECVSPRSEGSRSGSVSVEVTMNGVDFTEDAVQFRYVLDASVSHVTPSSGPSRGGTLLTVHGSDFASTASSLCLFEHPTTHEVTSAPAQLADDGRVLCTSPPMDGNVLYRVAFAPGQGLPPSGSVTFWSYTVPTIERVDPGEFVFMGSNRFSLFGRGFFASGNEACQVGPVVVPAFVQAHDHVTCVFSSSAVRAFSSNSSLTLHVAIALNGQDFESSTNTITIHPEPVLASVSPGVVPSTYPVDLVLSGEHLRFDDLLACSFGDSANRPHTPVRLDAEGRLVCSSPTISQLVDAHAVSGILSSSDVIRVEPDRFDAHVRLVWNGVDLSTWAGSPPVISVVLVPQVFSLEPPVLLEAVSTPIQVQGRGIVATSNTTCVFSTSTTVRRIPAHVLSNSLATCDHPGLPAGLVSFQLTNDGSTLSGAVQLVIAPIISLTSVYPSSVPQVGASFVQVVGAGFRDWDGLGCAFNGTFTRATLLNQSSVSCPVPPFSATGTVDLVVLPSSEHGTLSSATPWPHISLQVEPLSQPTGVSPAVVGAHASSALEVQVSPCISRQLAVTSTSCVFASSVVTKASPASATESCVTKLLCQSPTASSLGKAAAQEASSSFLVDVELGLSFDDGRSLTPSSVQLSLAQQPKLSLVFPTRVAPTNEGWVTVKGDGFVDSLPLACVLRSKQRQFPSRAIRISDREARCQVPVVTPGQYQLQLDNLDGASSALSNSLPIEVIPEITLESLQPAQGTIVGGTEVFLRGTGFRSDALLECVIGDARSPARFESANVLVCSTPPALSAAPTLDSAASGVPVSVALSGNNATATRALTFTYTTAVSVISVSPSALLASGSSRTGTVTLVADEASTFDSAFCVFSSLVATPARLVGASSGVVSLECNIPTIVDVMTASVLLAKSSTTGDATGIQVGDSAFLSVSVALDVDTAVSLGGQIPSAAFSAFVAASSLSSMQSNARVQLLPRGSIGFASPSTVLEGLPTTVRLSGVSFPANVPLECSLTSGENSLALTGRWRSPHAVDCELTSGVLPAVYSVELRSVSSHAVLSESSASLTVIPHQAVELVIPSKVSVTGGTMVLARGKGFGSELEYAARLVFSSEVEILVPATMLNSSTLFLRSPALPLALSPQSLSRNITASLTWLANGAVLPSSEPAKALIYLSSTQQVRFAPLHGSLHGGTLLVLSVDADLAGSCQCIIGGTAVKCESRQGSVGCVSPPSSSGVSGPVDVHVTFGEDSPIHAESSFVYTPSVTVLRTSTPFVSELGGSRLVVEGSGLMASASLQCVFVARVGGGSVRVGARWMSPTEMECETPRMEPGLYEVWASNNGVDDEGSEGGGVTVEVLPVWNVESVTPSSGRSEGGTLVSVRGSGFVESSSLSCRFGSRVVLGTFVSSSEVLCVSPGASMSDEVSSGGVSWWEEGVLRVEFGLSLNGLDFSPLHASGESHSFAYLSDPRPDVVQPLGQLLFSSDSVVVAFNHSWPSRMCSGDSCRWSCVLTGHGSNQVFTGSFADGSVRCDVPLLSVSQATLWVSMDEQTRWSTGRVFSVSSAPMLTSAVVSRSSSDSNTTQHILLQGNGFAAASDSLWCKVGSGVPKQAWVLSDASALCPTVVSRTAELPVSIGTSILSSALDSATVSVVLSSEPVVSQVSRTSVPAHTSVVLMMFGSGLDRLVDPACAFGASRVPASSVNSSAVACRSPSPIDEDSITVSLMSNGFQVPGSAVVLHVARRPEQVTFSPTSGGLQGGTFLVLSVDADLAGSCQCIIGGTAVKCESRQGSVGCVSPPSSSGVSGPVDVHVTFGEDSPIHAESSFVYTPSVTVLRTSTPFVSELGGSRLVVEGSGLMASASLQCVFVARVGGGSVRVGARWMSPTEMECETPRMEPGLYEVWASNNGVDDEGSEGGGVTVEVLPVWNVESVTPSSGRSEGGTLVSVRGSGFVESSSLSCRFGSRVVLGTFVSSSEVLCVSPGASMSDEVSSGGVSWWEEGVLRVEFGLSLNGLDFSPLHASGESHSFVYARDLLLTGMSPRVARAGRTLNLTLAFAESEPVASVGSKAQWMCRLRRTASPLNTVLAPGSLVGRELTCTFVPLAPGVFSVSVSRNGGSEFFPVQFSLRVIQPVKVQRVTPPAGPETGGFPMELTIDYFPYGERLECSFSSPGSLPLLTEAVRSGPDSVQCSVPSQQVGSVHVELLADGAPVLLHLATLQLLPTPVPLEIRPVSGPARGGTVVSIAGQGFVATEHLRCRFGGRADVPALFLSPTLVQCMSPPASSVLRPGASDLPRPVAIEVLSSSGDIPWYQQSSGLSFVYGQNPSVARLEPSAGPVEGGRPVTVHGVHLMPAVATPLVNHSSVVCRFGGPGEGAGPAAQGIVVPAVNVTTSSVVCVTPPMPRTSRPSASASEGAMAVEISTNGGIDFSTSGVRYSYTLLPAVVGVTPRLGTQLGGTAVVVTGDFFLDSLALACRFSMPTGPVLVRAVWLSPQRVRCITPRWTLMTDSGSTNVVVAVTNNGVDFSRETNAKFLFHPPVLVNSLEPGVGSSQGGTVVVIHGAGFLALAAPHAACMFDGDVMPMSVISHSRAVCSSPPHTPGTTRLRVSLNGVDFTPLLDADAPLFFFTPIAAVERLFPTFGPTTGGTRVLVLGSGFASLRDAGRAQDEVPLCRFGSATVPAEIVNNTLVSCASPSATLPGPVRLQLSLDGRYFSNSNAVFEFTQPVSVSSLAPALLMEGSRPALTVRGSGFDQVPSLVCKFEHVPPAGYGGSVSSPRQPSSRASATLATLDATVIVSAEFVNDDELRCRAPVAPLGSLVVSVSNNGVDFSAPALAGRVTVIPRIVSRSVTPSFVPRNGGTRLVVDASNLPEATSVPVVCRFNSTINSIGRILHSSDSGLAASQVECLAPASALTGPTSLSLALDGQWADDSVEALSLVYTEPSTLLSVSPRAVTIKGGAPLTLHGAAFADLGLPTCFFSLAIDPAAGGVFEAIASSAAVVINSTTVQCPSPTLSFESHMLVRFSGSGRRADATPGSIVVRILRAPIPLGLHPSTMAASTPALLLVNGVNFPQVDGVSCLFRAYDSPPSQPVIVPALVLSGSRLECRAPAMLPGQYEVELSLNRGVEVSTARLALEVSDMVRVASVSPSTVPWGTRTQLTIRGSMFRQKAGIKCLIHSFLVDAAFVTSQELRCELPPLPAGLSEVNVSVVEAIGPLDALSKVVQAPNGLQVVAPSTIASISPALGPLKGGTVVMVKGSGFSAEFTHACIFWGVDAVPATVVSPSELRCTSPPLPESFFTSGIMLDKAVLGEAPEDSQLTVAIAVTQAGNSISSFGPSFRYLPTAAVRAVFPMAAPAQGGSLLSVSGVGFVNSPTLSCKVGSAVRSATFVTSSLVRCRVPNATEALGPWSKQNRTTTVQVSNNGVDFSSSSVRLTFFDQPEVASIEPSMGPLVGGTIVTMSGRGFSKLQEVLGPASVRCRFGDAIVVGTLVSDQAVSCSAPTAALAGSPLKEVPSSVLLQVSLDYGASWTMDPVEFSFMDPPTLVQVTPSVVTLDGGVEIVLRGDDSLAQAIRSGVPLVCQVGTSLPLPCRATEANTLSVLAPPAAQSLSKTASASVTHRMDPSSGGYATVRVSANGGSNWGGSAATLRYVPAFRTDSIWPAFLSLSANQAAVHEVLVRGSGFLPTTAARCVARSIPGVWRDDQASPLSGPALVSDTFEQAEEQVTVRNFSSALPEVSVNALWVSPSTVSCHFPESSLAKGEWSVTVSPNGVQRGIGSAPLLVVREPTEVSVKPSRGPLAGGTVVALSGQGLSVLPAVFCVFDDVFVPGIRSSDLVLCTTPSAASVGVMQSAQVRVGISINGRDVVPTSHWFLYVDEPLAATGSLLTPSGDSRIVHLRLDSPLSNVVADGDWNASSTAYWGTDLLGNIVAADASASPRPVWTDASGMKLRPVCRLAGTLVPALYPGHTAEGEPSAEWLDCLLPEGLSTRLGPQLVDSLVPLSRSVAVEYSVNGQSFTSTSQPVEAARVPTVASVWPKVIAIGQPMTLTVTGTGFLNTASLLCRFDSRHAVDAPSVTSLARWISSTELRCPVPTSLTSAMMTSFDVMVASRTVVVRVSNDGGSVFSTIASGSAVPRLTFAVPPEIHSVSPRRVLARGGTIVTIVAQGIGLSPRTKCIVGGKSLPVFEFSSATRIRCVIPALQSSSRSLAAAVVVELESTEGLRSSSGMTVEYVNEPDPVVAMPPSGPLGGGTRVVLVGDYFARPLIEASTAFMSAAAFAPSDWEGAPSVAGSSDPASASPFGFSSFAPLDAVASDLQCRFGVHVSPAARWISPTMVECVAPQTMDEGEVPIGVSINGGVDWSTGGARFFYAPIPVVSMVDPPLGPASTAGTLVTVRGRGFEETAALACLFGDEEVPAYWVDSSTVLCRSPPQAPGPVPVRVTNNGFDFSTLTLSPNDDLFSSGDDASWDSPVRGELEGASTAPGLAWLLDQFDFGAMLALGRGVPGVPAFRYVPLESVASVQPSRGLVQGGIPVFVTGSGFVNSTALQCLFGELRARALFLSPTSVSCFAPPRVIGAIEKALAVPVRVANNGRDFSSSFALFDYLDACPPGSYCPGRSILLAPNGTYSAGYGNTNFTLCRPGTFQPRSGQTTCVPCPVGYFCPDSGLSRPLPCRPGMVCDTHGLIVPLIPCPPGHFCPVATKTDEPLDFRLVPFRTHILEASVVNLTDRGLLIPPLPGVYEGTSGLDVLDRDEWQLMAEYGLLSFDASKRGWEIILRPYPEEGFHLLENPPRSFDRLGLRHLHHVYAERPHPCPLGYYCRAGVAVNMTQGTARNFSAPQRCYDGFFCPRGSSTPEGRGPCPTGHYCPTPTDAYICPVGHYCPEVGNTRPLECYPGTYNPLLKQSNCTLCPPGHICPSWGMTEPEICPAGFVCIESGLPEPVVMCPPGFYCEAGTLTLDISLSDPPDPMSPPYIADYLPGFDTLLPYNLPALNYTPTGVLGNPGMSAHTVLDEWAVLMSGTDDVSSPFSPAGQLRSFVPTRRGRRLAMPNYGVFDDTLSAMRSGVLASLVSGTGAPTYNVVVRAPLKPIACFPGTFCLGGVASNRTLDWIPANGDLGAKSPQTCTEGTYCRYATKTAAGSRSCFPGHYCPPGSTFPTEAPLGTFTSSEGSVAPTLCFPGTYAPLLAHSACRVCPAGYSCAGYGTYEPTICSVATYRSLADSITCRLCPQGTFSQFTGLTDTSDCEPCPPGRVCGEERMSDLSASTPCPDGHTCGMATTKGKQFDHACPAGHYCFEQTPVENQLDHVCEPGHYCPSGTKGFLKNRNKCAVQFYCPEQTTEGFPVETKCPVGTTSKSGMSNITQCEVATVQVCDKLPERRYYSEFQYTLNGKTIVIADGENEVEVLRHINPVNETASVPYWRNDTIVVERVCPDLTWVDASRRFTQAIGAARTGLPPPGGLTNASALALEGKMLTVIGRNFLEGSGTTAPAGPAVLEQTFAEVIPLYCRFVVINDGTGIPLGTTVHTQAIVESKYRLYCPFPDFGLSPVTAAQDVIANVSVLELGGVPSSTSMTLVMSRNLGGYNSTSYVPAKLANCGRFIGTESQETQTILVDNWFSVRGLSMALLEFDFEHLPEELVYNEHYRVAISVLPSICTDEQCDINRNRIVNTPANEHLLENSPCKSPIELTTWFEDQSIVKRQKLNISLLALEDVLFRVEIHLLYGLFLPVADHLRNTTTVRIMSPTRALNSFRLTDPPTRSLSSWISGQRRSVRDEFIFAVIFRRSYLNTISAPLNLPPRFKSLERGRVIPMFNVSASVSETLVPWVLDPLTTVQPGPEYWNPPAAGAQLQVLIKKYREVFQETSQPTNGGDGTYAFARMLLPYMPYLSNCRGYDSHTPFFALTEDRTCSMPPSSSSYVPNSERQTFPPFPHPDDIKVVGSLDFFQSPIADVCFRRLLCRYEENLPQKDVNPRWFEVSGGTQLFQILRDPIDMQEFFVNGLLLDKVLTESGIDSFIPVAVTRQVSGLQGECTRLCFPRLIRLEVAYYQTSQSLKRIIQAGLTFDQFDRDTTLDRYVFEILYYPLNYLELVIAFAFERETFIFLFTVVGFITLGATMVYWAFHRLIARSNASRFRFFPFFRIVTPPPVVGVVFAVVPIGIIIAGAWALIKGDSLLWPDRTADDVWLLDGLVGHYMQSKIDPRLTEGFRRGRLGLIILVMGFYLLFLGSRIFVPRLVSKRERDIEKSRDPSAEEENTWTPTLWKRSHMLFVSILFTLFLTLVVEFSFWQEYGTYIWYVIVSLKFMAMAADLVLEVILKEALLFAPLSTAFGIVQSMVTLGAANFADFLIGYAIGFGLAVAERVYIGPFMDAIIAASISFIGWSLTWARELSKLTRRRTLEEELLQEEKQATTVFKKKEKEIEIEGQATVEPILNAFGSYANETLALFYQPILMVLFIIFRSEIEIPNFYNIREQDMEYYLWFALIITLFQLCSDMFQLNVLEMFHSWKIYDYLVYTRYRFLQREARWKGMEEKLDECIDEGVRTLDQMCFSSQFYFMNMIHTSGIMFFIFGLEMIIRAKYNFFGDPASFMLVPATLIACRLLRIVFVWFANFMGVWRMKNAGLAWHADLEETEDDDNVPSLEDLEKLRGATHEQFIMNQKITSETFRYKFLDYNREWLVAQLPKLLTPRTLRRSRPYLIAQFAKILGTVNDEISSDSSSDDDVTRRFGAVDLSTTSRTLIRMWLNLARRRMRLKDVVRPWIKRQPREVQADLTRCVDPLGDRFEKENPDMEEFDQVKWKRFFEQNAYQYMQKMRENDFLDAKSRGAAMGGEQFDEDDRFGPVFLRPAAKKIVKGWMHEARRRLRRRRGEPVRLDVSDDDEADDDVPDSRWGKKALNLSGASRAIAVRWLQLGRHSLYTGGGNTRPMVGGSGPIPGDGASKYRRK